MPVNSASWLNLQRHSQDEVKRGGGGLVRVLYLFEYELLYIYIFLQNVSIMGGLFLGRHFV